MTVEAISLAPRPAAPFAPQHRADRGLFLLLVGLTWLGVVSGFGLDDPRHGGGRAGDRLDRAAPGRRRDRLGP